MDTVYFIIQQTMFFAIPLLIVALGAMYSEKSGVTNIALEGIMIVGAFAGVIVLRSLEGVLEGQLQFIIAILVAAVVGGLYSLLHAWSAIRLKADQTISGTALNIFAPAFCIFASRMLYGKKSLNFVDTFHISKVPGLGDIPVIGNMFFQNAYISTYIGILLFVALAIIISKTRFGLRLSSCGENPEAAASAGIPVTKTRYIGVLISGLLGGAGGLIFIVPTSTNFSADVAGYGFLALSVLILGQWKPVGVLLAAFFFGILKAIASSYSGIDFLASLPIESEIYKIIPYLLTLVILAISSRKSRAPKAVGIPYDDGTSSGKKRGKNWKWISKAIIGVIVVAITLGLIGLNTNIKVSNASSKGYGGDLALVLDASSTIDDKSFVQLQWEGICDYSDMYGVTRKYYLAENTSNEAIKQSIDMAVKGNAKVVVCPTSVCGIPLGSKQYEYPDVFFVLADGVPYDAAGNADIGPNTVALEFAEEQSGFLAGYAAVKDGYRNLGFIGGMAISPVIRFGYGFIAGADYAAKELGLNSSDVKVRYNYAGTFSATPEVLSMAASWYLSGTEVIFACGGSLGNSVMKAAENQNKAVIGVDFDQSDESKTVITSAMKQVGKGLQYIMDSYFLGTLEGGKSYRLSVKEKAVGLPMETSRFRTFTQEEYDKIYETLVSGAITIPKDTDAENPNGLGLNNITLDVIS